MHFHYFTYTHNDFRAYCCLALLLLLLFVTLSAHRNRSMKINTVKLLEIFRLFLCVSNCVCVCGLLGENGCAFFFAKETILLYPIYYVWIRLKMAFILFTSTGFHTINWKRQHQIICVRRILPGKQSKHFLYYGSTILWYILSRFQHQHTMPNLFSFKWWKSTHPTELNLLGIHKLK